ncbi:MAG: PilZ domain-containing protein [Archangium sp.]|nr:PilZ domain-containing protein [Archangium sp.]MDP3152529.1 PilZ domain-containing protein [Archangium sp.]MDP3572301.1 PilZ domain-containing protein [Archangium sp.]
METEFFTTKRHRYTQARRYLRLPTDFVVHVRSNELRVNDRVNDISEAGIGVLTPRPLPPMTLVSMRLDLPHGVEAVEMLGRVMWATDHMMGIRFEQTDPRVTDLVYRIRQDFERI